jgi:TBC1 domain family member 2
VSFQDPLNGIRRGNTQNDLLPLVNDRQSMPRQERPEKTEKLLRERSIRTNRRNKFIECLSSQDVNIGMRNMGRVSILHF